MTNLSVVDVAAVIWLFACWVGYTVYSESRAAGDNLLGVMAKHREQWMMRMLGREHRIVDTQIVNSVINNATFFASTSILILAGLLAVLGAPEDVIAVVRDVPLAVATTRAVWEMKVITLALIFIYGFFKFGWSMRQFNYCAVLIGAAPLHPEPPDDHREYAVAAARVASLAAKHFNHGVRSYYFGMAALSWFVNPLFLFPAAVVIVLVLYRREFHSRTLAALRACGRDE